MQSEFYNVLLDEIKSNLALPPDQPDETMESTLIALWHAAAGNPCSAKLSLQSELEDLTESQRDDLRRMITERCAGRPLMQITKRAHFMGLELEFTPEVFIVRPETEILGNSALDVLRICEAPVLVDMGCGSGNLTCGISHELSQLKVYAVDIMQNCVDLTARNAARHGLSDRVSIYKGDLFGPFAPLGLDAAVDTIICNPPYIASSRLKTDRAYLTAFEPREAFDGGPFGFSLLQRLIKESLEFLKPGGHLLFEFGAGQDKQVAGLIKRAGGYDKIDFKTDSKGIPRVVLAKKAV